MSVLVLLIAAGGAVASGFLMAFVWAVRSGQFDDMWTPAVRVLLDARTTSTLERDESVARSSVELVSKPFAGGRGQDPPWF